MTKEDAAAIYPHFCTLGEDGVMELYLDNMTLSSFRKCQGYWGEWITSHPGKTLVQRGRKWSFEFGAYFHKMMEFFYQAQREDWEGIFITNINGTEQRYKQDLITFLQIVNDYWDKYDLNYFMEKEFKTNIGKTAQVLGGRIGATNLFMEYYKKYWRQERYRFIGWELSFGRDKRIPICLPRDNYNFRGYLVGRIDLLLDDTTNISPLDFKTTQYFDGFEQEDYKPHEGIQGYVYTGNCLLPEEFKARGRSCNSALIRHVSIRKPSDGSDRFKTSTILYTHQEMATWKNRQEKTFRDIYNALINEEVLTWNTDLCNMWFYNNPCPYLKLHKEPLVEREGIINTFYQIKEGWSPERNGNGRD